MRPGWMGPGSMGPGAWAYEAWAHEACALGPGVMGPSWAHSMGPGPMFGLMGPGPMGPGPGCLSLCAWGRCERSLLAIPLTLIKKDRSSFQWSSLWRPSVTSVTCAHTHSKFGFRPPGSLAASLERGL